MNTSNFYRLNILTICFLLGGIALNAQDQPEPIHDGLSLTALVSTYTIPDGIGAITMSARGGDGGDARRDGNCSKRGRGGSGAWTTATFEVGTGSGQLQPGGRLRIYVGQPGGESGRLCSASKKGPWGGGGGSTAVLYLPPGESEQGGRWYILMIAGGGGGGAVIKNFIYFDFDIYQGSGGDADSEDGDGGSHVKSSGYGGAGVNSDADGSGGGKRMNASIPDVDYRVLLKENYHLADTGGADPYTGDNGVQGGGDGFNGGGASNTAGAGGGGGYEGGGGGLSYSGNGGGSFITTAIPNTNTAKTDGIDGGGSGRSGVAYFFINQHIRYAADTTKALDIFQASTADGANIQLWTSHENYTNQQWIFMGTTIRSAKDLNKCIDVNAGITTNGTNIQLGQCSGGSAQDWVIQGQTVRLKENLTKCLSLKGQTASAGANVYLWDCNGTAAQNWVIN